MRNKSIYRKSLIVVLIASIIGLFALCYIYIDKKIPNNIHLVVNKEEQFDFSLPFQADLVGEDLSVVNVSQGKIDQNSIKFDFDHPFSIESNALGSYQINLKLFGLINYKKIDVNVIDEVKLIPGGEPVGIYIESDGIMVLGTSTIKGEDGCDYEPATNILKSGDYILKANGKEVTGKEQFINLIQQGKDSKLKLELRRNEEVVTVSITPQKTKDGDYKIGAWIRDNTQGIGTLTYVGQDGKFGALGHGITDVDTNLLMEIKKGTLFRAEVLEIVKGKSGTPGEIVGMIKTSQENNIGEVIQNSNQGIFGKINQNNFKKSEQTALPIGLKQDIKVGDATILCSVSGKVSEYDIKIEKVEMNSKNQNKGLVIKITDPELLSLTNGIVQGMSGSPIIQDGKIVGAVTHVFIQDSTKGYGTFIENMLKTAS